jgi:hypothetical protein
MSLDIISPNFTENQLHEIIRNAGGEKMISWAFEGEAEKKGDGLVVCKFSASFIEFILFQILERTL